MKLPCSPAHRFPFLKAEPPSFKEGGIVVNRPVNGTWYVNSEGEPPYIVCPECGHPGRLKEHVIRHDGTIDPSIVCSMAKAGDPEFRCTAHYYGKLEGYDR